MSEYSVALGTFDGLHLGHMAVLGSILNGDTTPLALTFNFPPKFSVAENLLITPKNKISRLKALGISAEILDFQKIKNLSPNEFLSFIYTKYSPKIITTGYNFRFGRGAEGTAQTIAEFCSNNNIEYRCTDAVLVNGEVVSSSKIRTLIASGDLKSANQMLGARFSFSGEVLHGDRRGRVIGFPTLNIPYPVELVTPKFGVYASLTEIDGKIYKSVTDIGVRPTFKTDYVISETNILNFDGEAYGKRATVYLVEFIRQEKLFGGLDELKSAIEQDKKIVLKLLENVQI
ncbi:MAG: riboflavin biosynthesis protein RibF [Clostridia bacterium]|nr:riboflavin biosynthesis protein RibF [Clostridia bacterium]